MRFRRAAAIKSTGYKMYGFAFFTLSGQKHLCPLPKSTVDVFKVDKVKKGAGESFDKGTCKSWKRDAVRAKQNWTVKQVRVEIHAKQKSPCVQ